MTDKIDSPTEPVPLADRVRQRLTSGARFAGLWATATSAEEHHLRATMAVPGSLVTEETLLPAGCTSYPALSPVVPSAAWYEREIRDLVGLVPSGTGEIEPPLLGGFRQSQPEMRSGGTGGPASEPPVVDVPRARVSGEGIFTIPYGPVRSGVFESVEYLVETPGEDIPHLQVRPHYKHRGVRARFAGAPVEDGVLIAERTEGVASVAHALAYCEAVERIAAVTVPRPAALLRVVHAELERIANHVDTVIRHTDAAGQAVAHARFSFHKERVLQLRAQISGSRFGRGVVVPGGVVPPPQTLGWSDVLDRVVSLRDDLRGDLRLLMATPSFVDRLRGTGRLLAAVASEFGALGPVGRGSGQQNDARIDRPYGAYAWLGHSLPETRDEGDALARHRVRVEEIEGSTHLIGQAATRLDDLDLPLVVEVWRSPVGTPTGEAFGWTEAPQGELLYLVELVGGQVVSAQGRSASFHNLSVFPRAFGGDVLTDFAFIEASFGLSMAGAAS